MLCILFRLTVEPKQFPLGTKLVKDPVTYGRWDIAQRVCVQGRGSYGCACDIIILLSSFDMYHGLDAAAASRG